MAEHLVADSYGYAKAALKAENPSIDFGVEWDKHSENLREYMLAHSLTKKKVKVISILVFTLYLYSVYSMTDQLSLFEKTICNSYASSLSFKTTVISNGE